MKLGSTLFLMILNVAFGVFANEMQHMHHSDTGEAKNHSINRQTSGTAWQADATPSNMVMTSLNDWEFMFHGNLFAGVDIQGTQRGNTAATSMNWLMAQVGHSVGAGHLSARAMLSLEPLTVPPVGYPLLFQSGETWNGQQLHDSQHPHDLFMELSTQYSFPLNSQVSAELYAAVVGEPALGPPVFMHRASAQSNPFAPLGHHWQDSTHISFGVLTLGLAASVWKIEASAFNGREPNENRYDIELNVPDSFAGRVFFNPIKQVSYQISYGYLDNPENHADKNSIHRMTASALISTQPLKEQSIDVSFILGINMPTKTPNTFFALSEANWKISPVHSLFSRLELGLKNSEDLVVNLPYSVNCFVGSASLGYTATLPQLWYLLPSAGFVGSLSVAASELANYYGPGPHLGGMVFLQVRLADLSEG